MNVVPIQLAISNENGKNLLFSPDNSNPNKAMSSLLKKDLIGVNKPVEVMTATIGAVPELQSLTRCDFIKIDVEGLEGTIICQLNDIIDKFRPQLIFEYSKYGWELNNFTFNDIYIFLKIKNYKLYMVTNRALIPIKNSNLKSNYCDVLCIPYLNQKRGY